MLSLTAILFLGFLLGMRHATDADHVVAVTTIVSRQRGIGRAGLVGALWGLGHTFTIFVVGAMIILFQVTIPPRVGLSMEFAVGAMLVLLGVLNLTGTMRRLQARFMSGFALQSLSIGAACELTSDGPSPSSNAVDSNSREVINSPVGPTPTSAAKSPNRFTRILREIGVFQVCRPIFIGLVHGLAGSAAVALLVMTTIREPWSAIAYLLLFGLGTVAGMVFITVVIALPFLWTERRFAGLNRGLAVASGLTSLLFGMFLTYQIGFVDGLFSSHPLWTPH